MKTEYTVEGYIDYIRTQEEKNSISDDQLEKYSAFPNLYVFNMFEGISTSDLLRFIERYSYKELYQQRLDKEISGIPRIIKLSGNVDGDWTGCSIIGRRVEIKDDLFCLTTYYGIKIEPVE